MHFDFLLGLFPCLPFYQFTVVLLNLRETPPFLNLWILLCWILPISSATLAQGGFCPHKAFWVRLLEPGESSAVSRMVSSFEKPVEDGVTFHILFWCQGDPSRVI